MSCVKTDSQLRRPLVDFNKPLTKDFSIGLSPKSQIAVLINDFVDFNHSQVLDKRLSHEILSTVDQVVSYLSADVKSTRSGSVIREFDNLEIYREVLKLYCEGGRPCGRGTKAFSESVQGNMVSLVYQYRSSLSSESCCDPIEFFQWLERETTGLMIPVSPAIFKSSSKMAELISYKTFSGSTDQALTFILNTLLRSNIEDPFLPRQVDDLLLRCMRQRGRDVVGKREAVRLWFLSNVEVDQDVLRSVSDSALARFMGNFVEWSQENEAVSGKIELDLCFLLLSKKTLQLNEYLRFLPALVALRVGSPTLLISQWPLLIALLCSVKLELTESVVRKLKILQPEKTEEHASAWDMPEEVGRNFGQLGIGVDPVEALLEVKMNGVDLTPLPKGSFVKYFVLALLFRYERTRDCVAVLLEYFGKIKDADKGFLGKLIVEKVFGAVCVGDRTDWEESVLESAISVIDFSLGPTDSSREDCLLFPSLTEIELVRMKRDWQVVNLLRFSDRDIQKILKPHQVPEWMADQMMLDPSLTSRGIQLAKKLGLTQSVHALMVTRLLEQGFDRDIDAFLEGMSRKDISRIISHIAQQRLAVIVRAVAEDSGRLHALLPAVLSSETLLELLKVSITPQVEENCVSWISDEGVSSLLRSVRELVHHPYGFALEELKFVVAALEKIMT